MRAMTFSEPGGPEVLEPTEVDDPQPGEGEILVRVRVAGVNFIDTYQRSGAYPLPLPATLGREGAGEVIAVGPGVTDRRKGDRVAWLDGLGSYAQMLAVPAERTVVLPDAVDLETAAAVMIQGCTAHFLSHSTYPLGEDTTALVYAAAGGVGRLLVQLAKHRGATVLACTSSDEKAAEVRRLGADAVIRYRDENVVARVRELTEGRGVDVVYDSVGRDTFDASLGALRVRGTLVVFGQSSGPVPPVDIQTLNRHGSLHLTRPSISHFTASDGELAWRAGALLQFVASGLLDVRVHERYPLEEAGDAHRALESGRTSGKLLLLP